MLRIKRVAHSVAEKVEREDGDKDRHAGDKQPGEVDQAVQILRVVQHVAPRGLGLFDADSKRSSERARI